METDHEITIGERHYIGHSNSVFKNRKMQIHEGYVQKKIFNLLFYSIDFHPIAIDHKPNSHINILPAPTTKK
jgi:hypothetical protein